MDYAFERRFYNEVDSLGTEFDYKSTVMYSRYAFSKNNKPTIDSKKYKYSIGHAPKLSKTDIKQARLMYTSHKEQLSVIEQKYQ